MNISELTRPLLLAEPLEHARFAPFGQVIEASATARHFTINAGNTERYHDLADVAPGPDGRAIISIFRGQPRRLPFTVEMLERHPLGSQAFMPISGGPYLVVVAPPCDRPGTEDIRVFLARGDQGVNYAPGVWHHPLLALDAVSDYIVVDRSGPGRNCDEIELDDPLDIDIPAAQR
ncbi:ureidoglycolate lyase [Cognatazoarcus halotolerans]|uniref:ureidoglycolate lyase n=1 Tax=Cognatazoarcus halotolerans TaxID=2686016 RepID=UPI00135BF38A|nr:ureidoglycolate lyase [Cognatazoarcus halotolerans]MCB1899982.1 ureidoglycolate lyase [Rhodocyclaceae bacterium]MCP5309982.1 ureidoglycolate lyase [Zoogloeaceae bacterium]